MRKLGWAYSETVGIGIINPRAIVTMARSKWAKIYGDILKRKWKPIVTHGDEPETFILHMVDCEDGEYTKYFLAPNEE